MDESLFLSCEFALLNNGWASNQVYGYRHTVSVNCLLPLVCKRQQAEQIREDMDAAQRNMAP